MFSTVLALCLLLDLVYYLPTNAKNAIVTSLPVTESIIFIICV